MFTWLTTTLVGKIISVFFVSMVPVIELRGGIPIGVGLGLDPILAMVICIIGNIIPVPFIIFFIRKIFEWMKKSGTWLGKIVDKLENKVANKRGKVEKYKLLGLFLFVAIPLPGTGAWTGALIAACLNMDKKHSFVSIFLGVLAAGIIVTALSYGVASLIWFLA